MTDRIAETLGHQQSDNRRCSWLRRLAWLLAALSIPISIYSLFQHIEAALLASVGACVLGAVALASFILAARKRPRTCRYRWKIAGLLLVMSGSVGVTILIVIIGIRDVGRNMRALDNMVAISWAIMTHSDRYGVPPPDLQTLVDVDLIQPVRLRSPIDPNSPEADPPGPPYYCSYVYRPWPKSLDGDQAVIIVHDRDAFPWPEGAVLSARLGRCVIYADGYKESLSESGFTEAMHRDAERRRQAELLTTQSAPAK